MKSGEVIDDKGTYQDKAEAQLEELETQIEKLKIGIEETSSATKIEYDKIP